MICRLFSVLSHYLNQWCLYLGTNFNKVLIEIHKFSYRKIHLYMSSATRHLFSFSLNVLTGPFGKISMKSELKSNIHTWRSSWKSLLYRLVSNIRRTPTLGNSQLEFSPTISLAKTSNTRRTPSFDFWVSIVDKVRSRPTWSELLRVAWDFDSPWIKGPMTPYQSRPYARHVAVIPAAKLCDSIAIVFLSIDVRIRHNLRRYIDASAILFGLSRDPYDPDDQRFHDASRRKLCGIKQHFDKITSVCDKLSISNYIFQA